MLLVSAFFFYNFCSKICRMKFGGIFPNWKNRKHVLGAIQVIPDPQIS